MPNKSFDSAVEAQLDMFRTSTVIEKDVLRVLLRLQKELISKASTAGYTEWGRRRVNQQIAEVKDLVKQYYNEASAIALEGTSAIAEASSKAALTSISVGSSSPLMPSKTVLEAIASQSVIQGATQGDWWARQSTDTAFRFSQAVRQGLAGAETNQQIVARVRGFLDTSRANAAGLVQTSVATIANDARQAVFENNQDIIKRYRAVATLDTNTCATCAPLDGLEWTKERQAIGHKFPYPNYPKHFNCRCLMIPVVLDGPQGGQRASDDGLVSADTTFSGWLKRQSTTKQNEILGKGRAALYRDGKITLSDLVRGNGSPLTLNELRSKYS
ncbi:MAG: minor capsid protein [Candidatus Paceibacterota bacterium]|jgi:SPP1 gp7 family putative phage head morphogenesis protein